MLRSNWRLACAAMLLLAATAVSSRAGDAKATNAGDETNPPPAAATATAASATETSSLDGIWMFDAKHSDDPRKIMEASRPQGGESGRRFGGGGFGGGPPGGGMGGGPPGGGPPGGGGRGGPGGEMGEGGDEGGGENADGEQRPRTNPFERVMKPAEKVVIEMLEDQVNVSEDERTPRAYALSDSLKAHNHELITDGTKALWKGGKLQMTQSLGRRGAIVETYELSADGKRLTIRARREGGREGMPNPTFTRVYTRYEGD